MNSTRQPGAGNPLRLIAFMALGMGGFLGLPLAIRGQSCTAPAAPLSDLLVQPVALLSILAPIVAGYFILFAAPPGRRISPILRLSAILLAVILPITALTLMMSGFCNSGLSAVEFALRIGVGLAAAALALRLISVPQR
ncbi:hypothetical protein [Gemmobacter serpentinus]|uniref:hypothetical protein n=1 Tax=Gemmobacter serpentinus TaxID=2652247 RepID=UPI00124D2A62|nr:hypothetical protein [Gemmobacter serpentinus]